MKIKNERNRYFPSKVSTSSFVRLYVLHLLKDKPYYGNEIIDEIKTRLKNKWEPSPGMIYPMLRELEEEGYIFGIWKEPNKRSIRTYKITEEGYSYYKRIKLIYEDSFEDSFIILQKIITDIYNK